MDIPPETTIWQPAGCQHCSFTGYHGRTGLHELLLIDDRIRTAIYQGEGELSITRLAGGRYLTLRGDGRQKVLAGETSWEEVVRVTESRLQEEE